MAEEVIDKGKELSKKKILSILPNTQELQGGIYNVKLYSCDKEGKNWLYSDVEGYLGFIIDYQNKTKYLIIYDNQSFEKLFQYELYNEFLKTYEELAPEFRCFEIDSGFMGFQFDIKEDAVNFDLIIKRLSGLTNELFSKPRTKEDGKAKSDLANVYCKKLREKFGVEEKYDEKYAEDGTTILKHNNFKILSNIEYNKDLKQFKFGKISEELKEMFLSFGIKKRDLERDADFAFTLFKKVIVGLGNENKLKNSALDSIEHNFPPPEEREKIRKQEEAAEAKMNSAKTKRTQQKRKETSGFKKTQTKSQQSKPTSKPAPKSTSRVATNAGQKGVPPPPPPPPPPPSVPTVPGNVPKPVPQSAATNNSSNPPPAKKGISMEEEIGTIVLKKVEKTPQTDKMIQGSGKNFLQNALSTAIRNRRNNLHMHDDDNEDDEEEDDWD